MDLLEKEITPKHPENRGEIIHQGSDKKRQGSGKLLLKQHGLL